MLSLIDWLNPDDVVKEEIDKFELYYFLVNQEKLDVFVKKGMEIGFKGNLKELRDKMEIAELFAIEKKPWEYFIKAVFLLKHYKREFYGKSLALLSELEGIEFLRIVREGELAKIKIEDWLNPLTEQIGVIDAIQDAVNVDIGNKFQILKIKDLKIVDKVRTFGLYPYVLEIYSAEEMVAFLKVQKDVGDQLIVTIQRNETYVWKSYFYLFLVYKGILYSIDNAERRLNFDNTEGCRSPARYIERRYENVWLPVDLLLKEEASTKELMVKGCKVYKIESFENIVKKDSAIVYWLMMFLYRVVDYVLHNELSVGILPMELPKLLASGNAVEFKKDSYGGAGDYLLDAYQESVKDIVVTTEQLPAVVGTQEYILDIIAYKKRTLQALAIQKAIDANYKKNSKRVYGWIMNFIKSWDREDLVKRALLDKDYAYMSYPRFCEERKIELTKSSILGCLSCGGFYIGRDGLNVGIVTDVLSRIVELTGGRRKWLRVNCYSCNKVRWKKVIVLDFIDYRQFVEFFGLIKEDIPKEMVQHLHQMLEMYVGNSILDDIDPIDELKDPWFREKTNMSGGALLRVAIPICGRCLRRLGNLQGGKDVERKTIVQK